MAILPTRTSADVNAAADINELSTEALDKGGTSQLSALTEESTPASGDWFVMEDGTTGVLKKVDSDNLPGGGGTVKWKVSLPAGSFDYPDTNYAPWERYSLTNLDILVHWFDDTTAETVIFQYEVPEDAATTGDVDFKFKTTCKTTVTGGDVDGEVKWRLGYLHIGDGENIDQSQSLFGFTETVLNDNAGYLDSYSYSRTMTQLGAAPGDTGFMFFTRIAATNQRSGDVGLISVEIESDKA